MKNGNSCAHLVKRRKKTLNRKTHQVNDLSVWAWLFRKSAWSLWRRLMRNAGCKKCFFYLATVSGLVEDSLCEMDSQINVTLHGLFHHSCLLLVLSYIIFCISSHFRSAGRFVGISWWNGNSQFRTIQQNNRASGQSTTLCYESYQIGREKYSRWYR